MERALVGYIKTDSKYLLLRIGGILLLIFPQAAVQSNTLPFSEIHHVDRVTATCFTIGKSLFGMPSGFSPIQSYEWATTG